MKTCLLDVNVLLAIAWLACHHGGQLATLNRSLVARSPERRRARVRFADRGVD